MKKFLALLLSLSLVCSSLVLLSSCSRVKEKDLTRSGAETLSNALAQTVTDFFCFDEALLSVAGEAFTSGSASVSVSGKQLLGNTLEKVSETVYFHEDRTVLDSVVKYDGETYSLRTYFDEKGITARSDALLGEGIYALTYEGLLSKLDGSLLLDLLPLGEDTLAEIKEAFARLDRSGASDVDTAEVLNAALEKLLPRTETLDVTTEEGTVSAVAVSYTINTATLTAALKVIAERGYTGEAQRTALAEIENMIPAGVGFDFGLTFALDKKSGKLVEITLGGEYRVPVDTETVTLSYDAAVKFSENAIKATLTTDTKVGDTTQGKKMWSALITRRVDDVGARYTLRTEADGEALLSYDFTYTKATGAISIKSLSEKTTLFEICGNVTLDKKTASIRLNSLVMGEVTVSFEVAITFTAEAVTPEIPTGAKDILTLSAEEAEALVEQWENSRIFDILSP